MPLLNFVHKWLGPPRPHQWLRPPRPHPIVLLATGLVHLTSLALPLVVLQVYDRVLGSKNVDTLSVLIIGLVGVLIIEFILRMTQAAAASWQAMAWSHRSELLLLERFLRSDYRAVWGKRAGEHVDRFSALDILRDNIVHTRNFVLMDFAFVATVISLIAIIAGTVVLVPITVLALVGVIYPYFARAQAKIINGRDVLDDRRYSFWIEIVRGISSVKAIGAEAFMVRRFERLQQGAASYTHDIILAQNNLHAIALLLGNVMVAVVVLFGAIMVMNHGLSIGGLAAITMLTGRSTSPMLRILNSLFQTQRYRVAADKIEEVNDLPESFAKRLELAGEPADLVFEDVLLRDADGPTGGVEPVNFRLPARSLVGLSGPSGSGKSRLFATMAQLSQPSGGNIYLLTADGKSHAPGAPAVIWLSLKPALFRGTILDNVTMFGTVSRRDALAAAAFTGLDNDVDQLPEGWATKVNDAGVLSAPMGQWIALTRAVALRPSVLLLDEINNSFDRRSDERFVDLLKSLSGRALIIIATNRPSLLRVCDRVLPIKDGQINDIRPGLAA